jgi:hypothetical protein
MRALGNTAMTSKQGMEKLERISDYLHSQWYFVEGAQAKAISDAIEMIDDRNTHYYDYKKA